MDTTFRQYLTGGGDPPVQLGNSRRSRSRADSYQVPTRYPLASAGAFTAFVNSVLSEAAQRVDLFSASGPSARAWAARIGLDDSRLRDGRSSVEGLSAAALPGLPSPRLTFAGRLRGDKAPDVLIEALALIDAPPPAYLVGDGPLRGALTRLIRARELEAVVHLPGWSYEPARYIAQATVHVVPSREESWSQAPCWPGARRPGRRHRGRRPGAHPGRGPRRPGPARGPPRPRRALSRVLADERPDPALSRAYARQFTPAQRPRYTLAPSGAGPDRVGCSPDRDGRAYGPPGHSAPTCAQRERPNRPSRTKYLRSCCRGRWAGTE
jgi:hypothetical protein